MLSGKASGLVLRVGIYGAVWILAKLLLGRQVSETLGQAYIKEMGRNPDDVLIEKAIARQTDPDNPKQKFNNFDEMNTNFPDIVDITPGQDQLYEIKTPATAAAGLVQLARYQPLLNTRYGVNFQLGLWNPMNNPYTIVGPLGIPINWRIRAWLQAPGLILYQSLGDEDDSVVRLAIGAEVTIAIYKAIAAKMAQLPGRVGSAQIEEDAADDTLVDSYLSG